MSTSAKLNAKNGKILWSLVLSGIQKQRESKAHEAKNLLFEVKKQEKPSEAQGSQQNTPKVVIENKRTGLL